MSLWSSQGEVFNKLRESDADVYQASRLYVTRRTCQLQPCSGQRVKLQGLKPRTPICGLVVLRNDYNLETLRGDSERKKIA